MFSTPTSSKFDKIANLEEDDHGFFSRLVSKETSMANPSFRVYYNGVSVAVPFLWESQPGTPKHERHESALPPLTPPPSFYSFNHKPAKKQRSRSGNLAKLLFSTGSFFTRGSSNASAILPTSSSSSSSSSSAFLLPFATRKPSSSTKFTPWFGLGKGNGGRGKKIQGRCYAFW